MSRQTGDEWLLRYQQQILLPGIGVNGQRRLEQSRVLMIGLGGLGCASAPFLVGAGIGQLRLVDDDRIEAGNLPRQTLYRESDVGLNKVDAGAARLASLNTAVDIEALVRRAKPDNLHTLLEGVDLVLDGSDNFATRYAINAACVQAKVPLISASAIGLRGQVAVLQGRPCYACIYPADTQAPDENCSHGSILGPLVGMVGALQAARAIQHLCDMPGAEAGTLWNLDLAQHQPRAITLVSDPACPVCRSA